MTKFRILVVCIFTICFSCTMYYFIKEDLIHTVWWSFLSIINCITLNSTDHK